MSDTEKKQIEEIRLLKMISGDTAAFEEVLSLYEKAIFNHLLRLTNNPDDASDLLQETFIRLYNNRSKIDITSNFKNWLYKVATNVAYDYFRKKKRENLISLDDDSVAETIQGEISYNNLEQEITERDLEHALGQLRASYRNILLLYYKERFSYEEIVPILKLPINTVKTHLRRARNELSELLKATYG
jgi:RNA polymerase sigma-70 factor (ECF subfamily)